MEKDCMKGHRKDMKGQMKGLRDHMRGIRKEIFREIKASLSRNPSTDPQFHSKINPTQINKHEEEDNLPGKEASSQKIKNHKEIKDYFPHHKMPKI